LPGENGTVAVLVVDDEPAIRLLCRVNLELEGYEVIEAASLDAARRELDARAVALVLLDMRIGHERGETLLDEINDRNIPVVVVTGSAELDPVWTSRTNAVLGKPFAIDDLLRIVRELAPRG
jgi:DNA-binding NtrC family response regulator